VGATGTWKPCTKSEFFFACDFYAPNLKRSEQFFSLSIDILPKKLISRR